MGVTFEYHNGIQHCHALSLANWLSPSRWGRFQLALFDLKYHSAILIILLIGHFGPK